MPYAKSVLKLVALTIFLISRRYTTPVLGSRLWSWSVLCGSYFRVRNLTYFFIRLNKWTYSNLRCSMSLFSIKIASAPITTLCWYIRITSAQFAPARLKAMNIQFIWAGLSVPSHCVRSLSSLSGLRFTRENNRTARTTRAALLPIYAKTVPSTSAWHRFVHLAFGLLIS